MMLVNATVQQRVKHFDRLLSQELSLIKREHEQNLITHKNLVNFIRRDTNRTLNSNRKKISFKSDEFYCEQKEKSNHHTIEISTNGKSHLSISSVNNSPNSSDEKFVEMNSKFRRQCTKTQRLPPIIRSNISNRQKQTMNDLHWMSHLQKSKKHRDSSGEIFSQLDEESFEETLPALTPIEKQIQSFMTSLPMYTGIQKGFDNFAPSSLYSSRTPVIMK
ncbi:unnamed protein product [Rotaria socialis]|uniref:Uncharacterized protein n=2 Tax=Rotaria socialis TaxID=392032 RepID=A0A820R2Y4_9BILA|nr:unnamed protein product [Rotaria socialis]CAF3383065.1 unnamed protein product [Rotaria socialis]CAF3402806.1 unnamed protein product [Rotaria socialis]CAF4282975.1 unnamed protein product [Rotaria socialis]CAF4432178.1 unnamed protein product [Rotaria socialis]